MLMALIRDDGLHCPYCNSTELRYAEDVTYEHQLRGVTPQVLTLAPEPSEGPPINRRIRCVCGETSRLPRSIMVAYAATPSKKEAQNETTSSHRI